MFFNFRLFFSVFNSILFHPKGHYRLTPKRFFRVFLFLLLYVPYEILTWFCFLADDILYPNYRKEKVTQPIFIIGNFRSGTTLLQRLMLDDYENTTGLTAREIVFASSILQRKIFRIIGKLDRLVGSPLIKLIRRLDDRTIHKVAHHRFRWDDYEEDDFLLLHSFSTFGLWLYSVPREPLKPLMRFDRAVTPGLRKKIMRTYRRLIQRHVHFHRGKRLISKNPTFSTKITSLLEVFPDAKFVYLVRDPEEVIPSQLNMLATVWHWMADPLEEFPFAEEVQEMAEEWYNYPLERLKDLPTDQWTIVRYEKLVDDPRGTVEDIYRSLGVPMNPAFASVLRKRAAESRSHRTQKYPLDKMGLSSKDIHRRFADVYRRFPSAG